MSRKKIVRTAEKVHHVVQYSGGAGSCASALRVRERYGTEGLKLLFADTLIEDQDLYRFLIESSAKVFDVEVPTDLVDRALALPDPSEDAEAEAERRRELAEIRKLSQDAVPGLVWIAEGRDPWEVFHDRRFLGNARVDPCSDELKRSFLRAWLTENHVPRNTTAYIGIDWTEEHRFKRARELWKPWVVEAPLCKPPLIAKTAVLGQLRELGIRVPRLYEMGFPHNNCGGFCVKAGMKHFKHLAQNLPERYAYHERQEQELRGYLDKDIGIMRDRRREMMDANEGKAPPVTMEGLRLRLIDGGEIDEFDWGGCGCAI